MRTASMLEGSKNQPTHAHTAHQACQFFGTRQHHPEAFRIRKPSPKSVGKNGKIDRVEPFLGWWVIFIGGNDGAISPKWKKLLGGQVFFAQPHPVIPNRKSQPLVWAFPKLIGQWHLWYLLWLWNVNSFKGSQRVGWRQQLHSPEN